MWQVIDASSGTIYDEYDTKREANAEARELNKVHNPPTYIVVLAKSTSASPLRGDSADAKFLPGLERHGVSFGGNR